MPQKSTQTAVSERVPLIHRELVMRMWSFFCRLSKLMGLVFSRDRPYAHIGVNINQKNTKTKVVAF